MIEIGVKVKVRTDGGSAAARKYAGRTGRVTTISPSLDAYFVQIDGNFTFETAFEERDLVRLDDSEEVG